MSPYRTSVRRREPRVLADAVSRREFLAYASISGWIPFLRPKHISLAGARFRIVRYGHSNRRYVVIHGNEESAREVLTAHMRAHQGVAYIIENTARTVPVESGQIDPNRMFSRAGAEANLKRLNPDWPAERIQAALAVLDRGRDRLVARRVQRRWHRRLHRQDHRAAAGLVLRMARGGAGATGPRGARAPALRSA